MKVIPIAASWDMEDCMIKASMNSVSKVKQKVQIWPWTKRISTFKRNWITWYWCSIIWWTQYTKCKNVISFNWNLIWFGGGCWWVCVVGVCVCVCAHMCICMCWYTWACMGVEGNLTYCSSEIFHLIIWDQVPGWSDTWPRGEVANLCDLLVSVSLSGTESADDSGQLLLLEFWGQTQVLVLAMQALYELKYLMSPGNLCWCLLHAQIFY